MSPNFLGVRKSRTKGGYALSNEGSREENRHTCARTGDWVQRDPRRTDGVAIVVDGLHRRVHARRHANQIGVVHGQLARPSPRREDVLHDPIVDTVQTVQIEIR